MTIRTFQFLLESMTPLLMHQDDVELSDTLREWRENPDNANMCVRGDDRSPPWTWKTCAYNDGRVIGIPSDNLMVSLRQAGAAFQIPGKRGKTYKEATQSGILIREVFLPIVVGGKTINVEDIESLEGTFKEQCDAVKRLGFMLFVKRAKIGASKHVRVRPRFDQWSFSGTMDITADEITDDLLGRLLELSGLSKGLCDWRPSSPKSPGPWGRFKATIKKVKDKAAA